HQDAVEQHGILVIGDHRIAPQFAPNGAMFASDMSIVFWKCHLTERRIASDDDLCLIIIKVEKLSGARPALKPDSQRHRRPLPFINGRTSCGGGRHRPLPSGNCCLIVLPAMTWNHRILAAEWCPDL